MRTRSRSCILPPTALLALTVVLCGGAVMEPGSAALLLQPGGDRATQLARDEAVAKLLSCLGDAAKELQKRYDGPAAVLAVGEAPLGDGLALVRAAAPTTAAPHRAPPQVRLIDLPPPVRAA